MLSPSKSKQQRVYEMHEQTAHKRAKSILNYNPAKYPPDIFYIRRNEALKKKYLHPENFQTLVERAEPYPEVSFGFRLFKLDKPLPPVSTYSMKMGAVKKYVRPVVTKHEQLRQKNTHEGKIVREIDKDLKPVENLNVIKYPAEMPKFEKETNDQFNQEFMEEADRENAWYVRPIVESRNTRFRKAQNAMIESLKDQ